MTKITHEYVEERKPFFHDIPPLLKGLTPEQWIERIEALPALSKPQKGWLALQVWWDLNSSHAEGLRAYARRCRAFVLRTGRDGLGVSVFGASPTELKTCPTLCEAMIRIGMTVKRCKDCTTAAAGGPR
jgi:hypothetical protein